MFIYLAIGIPVVLIITFLVSQYYERVRRDALEKFASELSLNFYPSGHDPLMAKVEGFKLFNSGHARKMSNVILGETEMVNVAIFDYRYSTGNGKNKSTHHQTVVAMESEDLQIPAFTLRPENFMDWFGSMIGLQDINFEDYPEFSKAFVLKGENEEEVREFLDGELLDFFVQRKGITFEGAPGKFIYFRGRRKTKPDDMRAYLEEGYSVYSAFLARLSRKTQ